METTNPQVEVRSWWERNPMTYDWGKSSTLVPGSEAFYRDIDRRFWRSAWFGHDRDEEPFSRLIDYQRIRGQRVLEIGCGAGSLAQQLAQHGAHLTAIDLTERAVNLTQRRFELFDLVGDIRVMNGEV